MRREMVLFRGLINKEFRCNFLLTREDSGKFQTIVRKDNDSITIYPSFMITISEGYNLPRTFVTSNRFFQFVDLLNKSIKVISDNLYEIFPNVNKIEFEIDTRTLERFQTEKALSVAGMTIIPAVWVDSTNQCFPAIRLTSTNAPSGIVIPLEDAIPMSKLLSSLDVNTMSLMLLNMVI